MSKKFDQSKDEVAKLCQYFANNRQSFLASGVKEAHIRQSLIDPFFEALGWDMRNAAMVAPRQISWVDGNDVVLTLKLRGGASESEKTVLQNAVTTTDAEIDRLVYELYGLTEEEIKIVEESQTKQK